MSFTDRLPRGAKESWRYDVIAPEHGLSDAMACLINREVSHLDLDVMHDWHRFLLRLIPNRDGFLEDPSHAGVFHLGEAFGVLLDADGQETGRNFEVSGWLEVVTKTHGSIAGKLSLKRMSTDMRSEAS